MGVNDAQKYHMNVAHVLRKAVAYGSSATTVSLGWVPPGAIVTGAAAYVTTAFNSGTSDTLDLGFREAGDGTADDTNEFATLLDLTTAGKISADELATAGDLYFPSGAEIVAVYTPTGTAATAGAAVAVVEYIVDNT